MLHQLDLNIYYDMSLFTNISYQNSLLEMSTDRSDVLTKDSRALLAAIFCIIFIVGLALNLACTTALFLRIRQGSCPQRRLTLIVLCLSVINSVYLLTVPFLVANLLSKFWTFGLSMCKMYSALNSPIMSMSSSLLLILINDLYLAICQPHHYKVFKRDHHTIGLILAATAYAFTTVLPIALYAEVLTIGNEASGVPGTLAVYVQTCVITMPIVGRQWYGMYTFVTSFLLPTTIEFVLLGLVILHGLHLRQMRENTSPKATNITIAAVGLSTFIFLCWVSFWTVTIMKEFNLISHLPVILHFAIDTLPYCCAALSPIFYQKLINSALESDDSGTGSDTRLLRIVPDCSEDETFV